MQKQGFIWPETIIKLIKLWPNARKQGRDIGQIWEVGYYRKSSGLNIIWLCDAKRRRYAWTITPEFLRKYFEVVKKSKIRNFYLPPKKSQKRWIGINGEVIVGRKMLKIPICNSHTTEEKKVTPNFGS